MADPQSLHQLWGKLDRLQQLAVAEALYSAEGRFEIARFRAKYGAEPNRGAVSSSAGWPSLRRWDCSSTAARSHPTWQARSRLSCHGLRPPASRPPTHLLSRYLRRVTTDESRKQQEIQIPVTVVETERAAQHDLHAVLRLIDGGKVRASETTRLISVGRGQCHRRSPAGRRFLPAGRKNRSLPAHGPGPIKAFAWPLILQSAGLTELAGSKLQLTAAGKKALSSAPHEIIRKAWERWLKSTLAGRVQSHPYDQGADRQGQTRVDCSARSARAIVDALAECPTDRWIETRRLLVLYAGGRPHIRGST